MKCRNVFKEAIRNYWRFGGRRRIKDHVRGGESVGRRPEMKPLKSLFASRYGKHHAI